MTRARRLARRALVLASGALFACALAWARPGGGQSFSGGGSRGGSSGGSSGGGSRGGGGFSGGSRGGSSGGTSWSSGGSPVSSGPASSAGSSNPLGFFVILGVLVVVVVVVQSQRSKPSGWQTSASPAPPPPSAVPRAALLEILRIDPEFSSVLFEDFTYLLYAEIQRARARGFGSISAFVTPDVALSLARQDLAEVRGVVIGAMRLVGFAGVEFPKTQVELEIESNYAEIDKSGQERRFWATERMTLARARSAKSRPPARARTLDCPSCGAPLSAMRGTQCSYCNKDVGAGRFDWCVEAFAVVAREPRGPLLLSTVEEAGTDFPTVVDPGARARLGTLQERDPAFDWRAFEARVVLAFAALQEGWSGRDLSKIRPWVSDNLFQSMAYWIDLYVSQRCRNMNDGARVEAIELANVLSDAHYDAITVRVRASGCDYTVSDDGKLLSGSRKPRRYTEYWTLIRGSAAKGASKAEPACPSCGAPLKISMVGNCTYCNVKVTSGDFDWVLSRIEQDEVYAG